MLFTLISKVATLMRGSTVLSLSLQLVFPVATFGVKVKIFKFIILLMLKMSNENMTGMAGMAE
jgi:hypothetical protein